MTIEEKIRDICWKLHKGNFWGIALVLEDALIENLPYLEPGSVREFRYSFDADDIGVSFYEIISLEDDRDDISQVLYTHVLHYLGDEESAFDYAFNSGDKFDGSWKKFEATFYTEYLFPELVDSFNREAKGDFKII